jgi:hypothetical protein
MFLGILFTVLISLFADAYDGPSAVNPYGKGSPLDILYVRNAVPLDQEYSLEKLLTDIQNKNLNTIEEVIAQLPKHMTDKNYVLMYRSRSLQEATPESPRAIVYTPTASFILTFNGGHKKQKGYNSLEMIQFRKDTQSFEFRELSFHENSSPQLSEANPRKCLACHQSPSRKTVDPRPNWDPYNIWIGAFGSNSSDIHRKPLKETLGAKILPQDREALAEQAKEAQFFKKYSQEIAPQHPRFSLLGELNLHATTDLTQHLQVWNLLRVQRLVSQESSVISLYKEIYAATMKCKIRKDVIASSPALRWHVTSRPKKYFDYSPFENFESVSSALTLLFEPLGVDTSDWSMDFGNGGRFAFYERFGTPANTQKIGRWAWEQAFPGAAQLQSMSCNELLSTGLKNIDGAFQKGEQLKMQMANRSPLASGREILNRCMSCHVNALDPLAPSIPLDQPQLMAPLLKKQISSRGSLLEDIAYRTSDMATHKEQMPPTRRLSVEERAALLEELKKMDH